MKTLTLQPIDRVAGHIQLPGSKSLSNRALLLAALAEGTTELVNLLDSEDVSHMLKALRALGIRYQLSEDRTQCVIHGAGQALSPRQPMELFLGNAGTAMRPLCAALCLGTGDFTLTGEPRMEERPIGDLVAALSEAGGRVTYLRNPGYPPLRIAAKGLSGGKLRVDGTVSSQFLTALLMALPMATGPSEITIAGDLVSKPYITMTLDVMERFGVKVDHENFRQFKVQGKQTYRAPGKLLVEGDASSASYFLAAAAIKGGSVKVSGVGRNSIQGDIRFADVLESMGATVVWEDDGITVSKGRLRGVDMDMNHIPDAAMTIATTALFAEGPTTLRNIYNWRVKETDRLFAMATELRKLGAEVIEGNDFLTITPAASLKSAAIDTYNDHRIAMCFSLAALDGVAITINDPGCTAKTFPDYFEKLAAISHSSIAAS